MTTPDPRARLRALIIELVEAAADPQAAADELLAEAVAANVVAGSRGATVALLRHVADELEAVNV